MPNTFNLALIKERILRGKIDDEFVHQTIHGQVNDILFKKSPIELEKILMNIEGKRTVIFVEGAPGSGKTTLAVYVCQSWSRGELLQEFTAVILIQLRDPTIQKAQTIADLLPCQDKEMAGQVARTIADVDGRGILWILDGWDELPPHLHEKSFLNDLITHPAKSHTTQSSMIVTSRPVASGAYIASILDCSLRIELLGLTREQQRQYFTEYLKGDIKAVNTLVERLNANPAIKEYCHLPMIASMVAHRYLNDGSIPTSVQGIYSSFVEQCLSCYLSERHGKTAKQASLQSLPRELQAPFDQLCKLAFLGIEENRVLFAHNELEAIKDLAGFCEVGLLQVVPSISGKVHYSFFHSCIQELLAAVHISHLPASSQISTFESLFGDTRFSAVFLFYAAITKLCISRPFLGKLPHWLSPVPAGVLDLVRKIIEKQEGVQSYQPKYLLVYLLRCLYAAQDPSLCQFVAKQLNYSFDIWQQNWLSPADCHAIGYFLSSISLATSSAKEFMVDLDRCSLGDVGTKSLMQGIYRGVDPHSKIMVPLYISLSRNDIEDVGASHIAEVLKNTGVVKGLELHNNPIGDSGLQMIFDSLKQNNTLEFLSISHCRMTDTGMASLAGALHINSTLGVLQIEDNYAITEDGLTCLVNVLSQSMGVKTVVLPKHLAVDRITTTINDARAKNGLAAIKVKGESTLWPPPDIATN